MKILFWLSLGVLVYTYFGYPFLMYILVKFKKRKGVDKRKITPMVSVVVSAYNEEASIRDKLENILSLEYPREKMEVIIASDASTDKTDEIVGEFLSEGVKLLRMQKRSGKIAAYRQALSQAKGEIIVFSDATSILNKESLINLVSNFNDKTVGCAGGLLMYINPEKANVGEGESKYWEYEKLVRKLESRLSSLTSVSGTLYAVRRELYPYGIKDDLADDLIVPINIKKLGFKTVLETEAVCKEFTTFDIRGDMAKRSRITIQNIRGLINQIGILNPLRYGIFSILVISHKLFRTIVPVLLLVVFLSSAILSFNSLVFLTIFVLQIIFYLVGFLGYLGINKLKSKIINMMFYFCLSNLAILIGIIKFFKGEKVVSWEPIRS